MAYNCELRRSSGTDFSNRVNVATDWSLISNKPTTYTPTAHLHAGEDITSGEVPIARLPTGTDNSHLALGGHLHDDRYYTETEIQNNNIYMRNLVVNANGVPTGNLGAPSVAEMALFQEEFNNKTEFYDITKLTFETYDGTSWTDITSTISDADKKALVGGDSSSAITIPNGTVKYRITFRAVTYTYINAMYVYWSSSGNTTTVHIWKKHDSGSWTQHTSSAVAMSSWPGHLYLPFPVIPWHSNGDLGTHYHEIRVELTPTWNHATNPISLYKMQWWGGYPAGKRTVYSVNSDKVVTFPSTVKVGINNVIVEGDARLSNSRSANDVYAWAKATVKPAYNLDEVSDGTTYKRITSGEKTNLATAYNHSVAAHAPSNAQKNSDITLAEINAKLVGENEIHYHSYAKHSAGNRLGLFGVGGDPQYYADGGGFYYDLYHTGNKPAPYSSIMDFIPGTTSNGTTAVALATTHTFVSGDVIGLCLRSTSGPSGADSIVWIKLGSSGSSYFGGGFFPATSAGTGMTYYQFEVYYSGSTLYLDDSYICSVTTGPTYSNATTTSIYVYDLLLLA